MPANTNPIFQLTLKGPTEAKTFVNADASTLKTIFTAGADGSLVDNIAVTSDDTSDVVFVITVNDGSSDFTVGELNIPAGSGTDGVTPAVNLLDATALPWLQTGGGLPLAASSSLKVNAKTTVTAAKTVTVMAFGGDY